MMRFRTLGVIPAGPMRGDGKPAPITKEVLDNASVLYKYRVIDRILVVGGWRYMADSRHASEVMAHFLIGMGVPKEAVSWIAGSIETIGNIRQDLAAYLRRTSEPPDKILFISERLHARRIKRICRPCSFRNCPECFFYRIGVKNSFRNEVKELFLSLLTDMDPTGEEFFWLLLRSWRMWRRTGKWSWVYLSSKYVLV